MKAIKEHAEDNDVVGHAEVRRSEIDEPRQKCRYDHPGVRIDPELLSIKRTRLTMAGEQSPIHIAYRVNAQCSTRKNAFVNIVMFMVIPNILSCGGR